jgi:hypothetical protein
MSEPTEAEFRVYAGMGPQPRARKRFKVEPEQGGRLEQFLIVNKLAADAEAEAREAAGAYKESIKGWLLALFPDPADLPDAFDIAADPHGRYPAYTMTLKTGSHLDRGAMERDGVYEGIRERYSVPNRASWELRESTGGRKR